MGSFPVEFIPNDRLSKDITLFFCLNPLKLGWVVPGAVPGPAPCLCLRIIDLEAGIAVCAFEWIFGRPLESAVVAVNLPPALLYY